MSLPPTVCDGFASLDEQEAASLSALIRPPPAARSYVEFAGSTKVPDGPKKGKYLDPKMERTQYFLLEAMDSGKWRRFVTIAPSQRGKTLLGIIIPWMHAIVELRRDVGYVMPNLDKLAQNWSGKIKPTLIKSGFKAWLPDHGPGSKDGRPSALTLTDPLSGNTAITYFMAAGKGSSETSLSSVSPSHLAIDEVDDFEDAGQVELALKRLQAWEISGTDMAVLASTVNARGDRQSHPALDFYNRHDATRCRIAHKCQDCGWYQIIQFDQLDLITCQVRCSNPKCGVLWSEDHRHTALDQSELAFGDRINNGIIVPCDWETEYFSILSTGFDYHMGKLSTVPSMFKVAEEKEKAGDYSLMENFKHKWLCEAYSTPVDHNTVTDRMLSLRSSVSKYQRGTTPDGVGKIVIGVDVQGDRCYWVVLGGGIQDKRYIIDYGEWFWAGRDPNTGRVIEPTDADRHAILNKLITMAREGWPVKDGTVMKAAMLVIDIGYNPGGSIGRWCAQTSGVMPVRGDHEDKFISELMDGTKKVIKYGRDGSQREADFGFYEVRKQTVISPDQPVFWWMVRTQSVRENVAGRLRLAHDEANSLMLPYGIPEKDYLIQHLSAWAIVRDQDTKVSKWVQIHKRDDYLDALCYAMAALSTSAPRKAGVVGTIKPREPS